MTVEAVCDSGTIETVYNCRVAEYHTYFVGSAAWQWSAWAHNACNGAKGENGAESAGSAASKRGPNSAGADHLPPKVLQTGGHTITSRTRKALGLSSDQAKRAMEDLKTDWNQGSSNHQHKILDNGDVLDSHTGKLLGNLFDFLS